MSLQESSPSELYQIIRLVRPLYKALEASVTRELASTGINVSQRAVLEQLLERGQTVPAIGRALILPRQFIQKTVNELLAAGLVEKRANDAHKRSPLLELTADGSELIDAIKARESAVMRPIAASLSSQDLRVTRSVLTEMIDGFRAHNTSAEEETS
ncbi:MAG: helix-turn-helix domain-containing protein [Pseudomonadota bacterium]